VRPTPAPPGLPPCTALGGYDGVLRQLILAYKENGRHGLAAPLGALLAQVIADVSGEATVLVPVPATAEAARRRFGDHVRRLAGHAAARLRAAGRPASVANPLRALPRPDSVGLSGAERLAVAGDSFRVRATRFPAGTVVVVDDLITTGGTAAAVTARLAAAGVPVRAVAVLAATARRSHHLG
jgi:predicted amidophosphoribosyltransferase